jgi:DNA replicative helicase MCM subunit Mcm2 (Cdc46/Mcm family)
VIRQAWDDGDLRTAVKNSPNSATGAHISIMAHVTGDEVRRELCATDQANGFANRFQWYAVRRSKCLPEGGNLDDDNLNDLVTRTHRAIEFAKKAGVVTRDDDARKLWCDVYPELSEGKPGLLGAITARAEAQVLRLSLIYALLDLSTKVRPEHLRAALALWEYSERSARWIFVTATGDVNADRILSALRAAGSKGMTQTQISERLFNRNVPSTVLSASLRILHESGKIKSTKESTGGAPRTRWFAREP